jgi:hypothetical protein
MQFGKEIRDVLVALETATADAVRAVDRMNESESDLDALLAGTAVSRIGELNQMLFSKIEQAAVAMIADILERADRIGDDVADVPRGWMN